jgi:hypothetical protein
VKPAIPSTTPGTTDSTVSAPVQPRTSKRLLLALQVFLTLGVVYAFLYVLALITGVQSAYRKSQQLRESPPAIFMGNAAPNATPSRRPEALWPEFPRTGRSNLRQSVINGVEVLSEDWETAASADEILTYYRQQMTARGWRDSTEDTYGLQPQLREWQQNQQGVQNEKYLEAYRKVTSTSLALKRGNWSVHVLVDPSKELEGGSLVKIFGAATPSIRDFFTSMAAIGSSTAPGESTRRALDATQVSGGERYHTTMDLKPLEPQVAIDQALAQLREDGWNPLMSAPTKKSRSGVCLWLTKGTQYAFVVADRSPTGQGSTVTMTEVSPAP